MNGTLITFAGNLANDPELRFTPGGHAVCMLTVLVNKRVRDGNGGWKDGAVPTRHEVELWRQEAENAAESFVQGSRVLVTGTLETKTWTDHESHENRYRTIVVDAEVAASTKSAVVKIQKTTRATEQQGQDARAAVTQSGTQSGTQGNGRQGDVVGGGDPWGLASADTRPTS